MAEEEEEAEETATEAEEEAAAEEVANSTESATTVEKAAIVRLIVGRRARTPATVHPGTMPEATKQEQLQCPEEETMWSFCCAMSRNR